MARVVDMDDTLIALIATDHAAEAIRMGSLSPWDAIGGDRQAANLAYLAERTGLPVDAATEALYVEGYDATIRGAIEARR